MSNADSTRTSPLMLCGTACDRPHRSRRMGIGGAVRKPCPWLSSPVASNSFCISFFAHYKAFFSTSSSSLRLVRRCVLARLFARRANTVGVARRSATSNAGAYEYTGPEVNLLQMIFVLVL